MVQLGRLEKVKDLRLVWKNEAQDFTKWLAKEENLNLLGNELDIDIDLINMEAKTGSFSTDILAMESNTENKIVIENQLESTDHDHLGKIITYASGHDAKTIIWIVKDVREEHRRAIDWLNEHTDEDINIFLCRIELWKIDESNLAPKFQIVSSPNNWTKTIKRSTDNKLSATKLLQLNYWTKLAERLEDLTEFNARKPNPQHWYNLAIGSSLAHISLTVNTLKKEIRIETWISDNKDLYDYLESQKEVIEKELGYSLNWERLDDKKASRISISKKIDINKEENWDEAIDWHLEKAVEFYNVFSMRIKDFN